MDELAAAIERLGLAGRPVCLHSALRSFAVRVSPQDLVAALVGSGCTVLVPTFSPSFAAPRPGGQSSVPDNAEDDGSIPRLDPPVAYSPDSRDIDPAMGAAPRFILEHPARVRGNHAVSSFAALGPLAAELVGPQSPHDVFAPLRELVSREGAVLLVGVGLTACTALHLGEEQAGDPLLVRWARGSDGGVGSVRHGGCSRGFEGLAAPLAHLETAIHVLGSRWRSYPAGPLVAAAQLLFTGDPRAGRCADATCARCRDRAIRLQHRT